MIPASPGSVLLTVGRFELHWYGIIMALAVGLGVWVAQRSATKRGQNPNIVVDGAFWIIIVAIIGARLYHVWNEWWWYRNHLADIPKIWEGGLAFHGALIFGLATLILFSRIKKISPLVLLDVGVIGVALGQTVGRLGNYFNQELFGKPSSLPWAVLIQPEHRPIQYFTNETFHPLFLYEALLLLVLFFILLRFSKTATLGNGRITGLYFAVYGCVRFGLDFLRIDQFSFGFLTVAQWVSIIVVLCGLVLLFRRIKNNTGKLSPSGV